MNEDGLCPKCKGAFSEEDPPKKLINCSHSLCHSCLLNELICPIDRTRIEKRKYTLEAFLVNHDLLQQLRPPPPPHHHNDTNDIDVQAYSSHSNKSRSKVEFTTPMGNKYTSTAQGGSSRVEEAVVVEVPCLSPQKRSEQTGRLTMSPKNVRISFDTCLLHSKKADLICLEDRCLICANCGLFGQHKLHKILPYDQFLAQYSTVTEESFKIYEQLRDREEMLNDQTINAHIEETLREKRDSEVKHIKSSIAGYIDFLRKLQRQLIGEVDTAVGYKRRKMGQLGWMGDLQGKRDKYVGEMEAMSRGVDDIFNLQNIGHYIDYIDKDSPSSYIISEGEYLLLEIDNTYKHKMQLIAAEAEDLQFQFTLPLQSLRDTIQLKSKDANQINALIEQARKKTQQKANPYGKINTATPNRVHNVIPPHSNSMKSELKMSPSVKLIEDDPLLIGSNSKSGSKGGSSGKVGQNSPMQPYTTFQFELSSTKEQPRQELSSRQQVRRDIHSSLLTVHQFNPSLSRNNPSLLKPNELSHSRAKSRTKSTHNHSQQGNVLVERNDNLKRKKLDLPEKYQRVYEELMKDKLEVLDLGGAFLGQGTVLAISELFSSRTKLRTAKLMNNKIGDDAFPELLRRCRQLTSLNLSYNLLSEKSLDVLEQQAGSLGELKNITLSNNKIVLRHVRERLEGLARRGVKVSL